MNIICSIDDGAKLDLNSAELLEKHGLRGLFFIPVLPYVEEKGYESLNTEDIIRLSKTHEIGSHTITHRHLTKIPQPQSRKEIHESKHVLEEIIGKDITAFCYPRGYSNQFVRSEVEKAGYTWARNTRVGSLGFGDDPFNMPTTVHVYNGRTEYKDGWLKYARRMLKQAVLAEQIIKENGTNEEPVYHLWLHSWEVDRDGLWNELDDFLGELSQHGHQ